MKPKAMKNFELGGVFYESGDEVEIKTKDQLIRLNEKGFIEPLTPKEIQNFKIEKKEGGLTDDREDTRQYRKDR